MVISCGCTPLTNFRQKIGKFTAGSLPSIAFIAYTTKRLKPVSSATETDLKKEISLDWPQSLIVTRWQFINFTCSSVPGRVAQSVTCLATDASLTANPGVASSIPVRYHTFVEIDHEIISTVILLPSADLFKKGCCQLQAKVCARITG